MFDLPIVFRSMLVLLLCTPAMGCGSGNGPLTVRKNKVIGPWCAPNQRVQIGDRVVGHVHDGPKYKDFFIDDEGREHDPDKLTETAWTYLERTGDAKKMKDAFSKAGDYPAMTIMSIKPMIVILATKQSADLLKQMGNSPPRWFWVTKISTRGEPTYQKELQWFSPDLKQKPTKLAFSLGGIAEISLGNGTLKLSRNGERCKTERE
jgi:hypothetical protein